MDHRAATLMLKLQEAFHALSWFALSFPLGSFVSFRVSIGTCLFICINSSY